MNVVKRLMKMVFSRSPLRITRLPRSGYDYLSAVGDGTGSSTVMAPLLWIVRTFPEAPPALWQKTSDGLEERILNHSLLRLLRRPNPFYSGRNLWMATVLDWNVDGNAYWIKVRNGAGKVVELWWAPHWMMQPRGTADELITHYEYRVGGYPTILGVDDVVHFRFGIDADDTRMGYSPLKSVLREVFTDDEAANFTASLLRNMGIPGLVISPDGFSANPDDAKQAKEDIKTHFTGDKRGEALVLTAPTKVDQFGFSPEELVLKDIRRIPEERVSAITGVPAVVAGLGAGLDRSTFTNYAEAREAAYEQAVIPTQAILSEDVWFQLLSDFETEAALWSLRFGFDLSNVRVLQEDRFNLAKRMDTGVRGGQVMVAESRKAQGLPVTDADYIYLRPMNTVAVSADGKTIVPYSPPRTQKQAATPPTQEFPA